MTFDSIIKTEIQRAKILNEVKEFIKKIPAGIPVDECSLLRAMGYYDVGFEIRVEPNVIKKDIFDNIQSPEKMHHVKWVAPRARRANDRI